MGPECYFERKLVLANDLSRTKGERMRDVYVFVCVLWEIGLSPWTKWQHSHALNRECLRLNATMCADGICYWQYLDIVTHIKTISSMVLKKLWHSPLCRTHHHPIFQHFAVYFEYALPMEVQQQQQWRRVPLCCNTQTPILIAFNVYVPIQWTASVAHAHYIQIMPSLLYLCLCVHRKLTAYHKIWTIIRNA